MLEQISSSIIDLAMLFLGLSIVIGLIKWRKHDMVQRLLFIVISLALIAEFFAHLARKTEHLQSAVYYIFTLIEFGLLSYIFRIILVPFLPLKWFQRMAIFFVCFVAVDMIWLSGFDQFNTYSTALESLLLIFLSLVFFHKTLKELSIEHLERVPIFWISTAILLYFSSSLFIFLFSNKVKDSLDALYILWGVHAIFNILHYLFYSIALWKKTET